MLMTVGVKDGSGTAIGWFDDGFKKVVRQTKHMFDSRNKRLIAETVFDNPEETFHIRGLAEKLDIAPSTVSRAVKHLEETGLIHLQKDLKTEITASNTEKYKDYKKSYNLWKLAESDLIDELMNDTVAEAIVLFGSYSKGEDNKESDIDIAIINGREHNLELLDYEEELNRKISTHQIKPGQADDNFIETLANGIILRGYLDL